MPNLYLLGIVLAIVLMLCHHSSKHNEEESRRDQAAMPNPTEPAMVQGEVSGPVLAFCFLIVVVGLLLSFATR